jgi:phosphoribosylformylglycinamidine cyclo-ligase
MAKCEGKPDTYAKSGVDFRKEDRVIKGIKGWVCKTFNTRAGRKGSVLCDIGAFANLVDMGEYALAISMDGVGSKVLVAQELGKFDTVGIDCVAMNVNDIICVGAEPITMVDYLAMESTDDKLAKDISKGLYEGAKQADIAIVGGETASLPDMIKGVGGRGFDLAGTVIGTVRKEDIITGEKIAPGDVVLGLKSSGFHSNGYTLVRKVMPKSMWPNIMAPTRIYVKEILSLIREFEVKGLAHITGGGFLNLLRLTKNGFLLDSLPEPPLIFKKIQELGKVSDEEMHKTFNMGVGFCVIASPDDADRMLSKYGPEYGMMRVGQVTDGQDIIVERNAVQIKLKRTIY